MSFTSITLRAPINRIFFSRLAFTAAYDSFPSPASTWNTGSFVNMGLSYSFPYASMIDDPPLELFAIVFAIIAGVGGGGRMFGISGPSTSTLYLTSSGVGPLLSSFCQRRAEA